MFVTKPKDIDRNDKLLGSLLRGTRREYFSAFFRVPTRMSHLRENNAIKSASARISPHPVEGLVMAAHNVRPVSSVLPINLRRSCLSRATRVYNIIRRCSPLFTGIRFIYFFRFFFSAINTERRRYATIVF